MPNLRYPVVTDSDPDPGGPDQLAATIDVSYSSPATVSQDFPVRAGDHLRWKVQQAGNPVNKFTVQGLGGRLPVNDFNGNPSQVEGKKGRTPLLQVLPESAGYVTEFVILVNSDPVAQGVIEIGPRP